MFLDKFTKNYVFPVMCLHFWLFNFFQNRIQSISTLPVILSFIKFCVARALLVELHLDDVLEVLLGVGTIFLQNL